MNVDFRALLVEGPVSATPSLESMPFCFFDVWSLWTSFNCVVTSLYSIEYVGIFKSKPFKLDAGSFFNAHTVFGGFFTSTQLHFSPVSPLAFRLLLSPWLHLQCYARIGAYTYIWMCCASFATLEQPLARSLSLHEVFF